MAALSTLLGSDIVWTGTVYQLSTARRASIDGALQKDGSITATGALNMGSHKITAVTDPTSAQDAATKKYVDDTAAGLSPKGSCRVASTSNVAVLSGILTTIDGTLLSTPGDRVLLTAQSTASQNGIWVIAAGAWTRPADFTTGLHVGGAFMFVESGTSNSGDWAVTNVNGTNDVVDTDSLVITEYSGAGPITVGAGLTKSGNTLDRAALTGDATASAGSNALTIAAAAVTLAKMANLAQDQFIGRVTASTGVPETATVTSAARTVLAVTTVAAMVDTLGGASAGGTGGLARLTSAPLVTPILGTPTSGTLTSCTGLPISTGVSGLGSNVAAFLATPTSANFLAAISDETGSGLVPGATSPTLLGTIDASGATALLHPVAAGAAPTANGDERYDSTKQTYVVGTHGETHTLVQGVSSQQGTTDTITASVVNTTETAFAMSVTIKANSLIANKAYRLTYGLQHIASGTPVTMLLKLHQTNTAGATLWANPSAWTPNASLTSYVGMTFLISGTAAVGASVNVITTCNAQSGNIGGRSSVGQVSLATNADIVLILSGTYSGNTAGNSITLLQAVLEEIN